MTYTGHKDRYIQGQTIAQYVRPTIQDEANRFNVPMPTDEQIALVVSALRMHHIMVHASDYDRSELGKPDQVTDFYPIESSIGRFFRDSARVVLDEHELSISLCKSCYCMTKTVNDKCGKCKQIKKES